MNGRQFLNSARRAAASVAEEEWRTAGGRAYYALMIECRDALLRWGIVIPRRDNVHTFVRLRFFVNTEPDLRIIGDALGRLGVLRNEADYQTATPGRFVTVKEVLRSIADANQMITLLDLIDNDPARRAAAIALIRTAWP